jgi:hypothetical protein
MCININQMRVLKYYDERFENLNYDGFSQIEGIKTHGFSTLYRTIPQIKLKSRLFQNINNCVFKRMAPANTIF